jgi:hypothetical protein
MGLGDLEARSIVRKRRYLKSEERFGVDNPLKSLDVQDRMHITYIERYGHSVFQRMIMSNKK